MILRYGEAPARLSRPIRMAESFRIHMAIIIAFYIRINSNKKPPVLREMGCWPALLLNVGRKAANIGGSHD